MKVRCVKGDNWGITKSNIYEVIKEGENDFKCYWLIVNDKGEYQLYKKERFKVVNEENSLKEDQLSFFEKIDNNI